MMVIGYSWIENQHQVYENKQLKGKIDKVNKGLATMTK